jgi:hypothetical protein
MKARALRTLIIGSALAGAFVLGAVFEHLKPWQRKAPLSAEDESLTRKIHEHFARAEIPRVLARCIAAGIAVPMVPSDPADKDGDRRSYVMACMRGEGFEYGINERLGGDDCDIRGYHHDYENERCYDLSR